MPYVPSKKTVPPAEDRKILDPAVEALAKDTAVKIINNPSLNILYKDVFLKVADVLSYLMAGNDYTGTSFAGKLAKAIYEVSKKYGYWGAHQGELNYSITRFIQRVPQIMVEQKKWAKKNEFRYWVYASTVSALRYAADHTENLDIVVDGVFEDIKDEYKWKVNRAYEAAQIVKSGDCYDTPYYTRLVAVVDEDGKFVGYLDVYLKRDESTIHKDVLDYELVLRKKAD